MNLLKASILSALLATPVFANNTASPTADPVLDPPTLHCLGVYWTIRGDDNSNATVHVQYRQSSTDSWRDAMNLFRVEKGSNKLENGESLVKAPADAWLFAGSIVSLKPATDYEVKLSLSDPDGGQAQKILRARTLGEPIAPAPLRVFHVVPGSGGGDGSLAKPFGGLAAAQAQARPGDQFLLHAGVYAGTFEINRSGQSNAPIVWQAAGDGEAILDAQGPAAQRPARGVSASDIHDVWFENLTIRHAEWGMVLHASHHVVVRHCHFQDVLRGITGTRNTEGRLGAFFISDNLLEGTHSWNEPIHGAKVEEDRGIELSGAGNVICYNRVRNFKDGIDLAPSLCCIASDVHNNEVSECLDDGCEMDGSERNCRCYENRFTDIFQGISTQPVYGGPIYIFRNALFNVEVETFKMHNRPSGGLFLHNTSFKKGYPLLLWTSDAVHNCFYRNNLFIGTEGRAYDCDAPMVNCDFDNDGFGGFSGKIFLKWNKVAYATPEEVRAKAPIYKHVVTVDPAKAFAARVPSPDPKSTFDIQLNDLRLALNSEAVNAGQILPNFNDTYSESAPDLGAYELNAPLPHYGPR